MFPANGAGFALVILRCCVVLQLVLASTAIVEGISPVPKIILVAATVLALCLGAFSPLGCLISVLLQAIWLQPDCYAGWQLIVPLALPIALLLLGPGAYSIDAKRYGVVSF
jgi:uncharacterized membrane protein YphA (DoxX/SURF4 family)